jgi:hypothetical protein
VPPLVAKAVGVVLVFPVLAPPPGPRLLLVHFLSIDLVHLYPSLTMRVS